MNFVRALLAKGYDVHTVAPHDNYTHYLEELGCTHHNVKMDSRGANPIKDLALMFELWGIYRKVKPDIILHYTIKPNVYGTLAASLLRIPTINNVCGLGTVFLKNNLVSAFAMMLYKVAFRFPRKVFFQNPDDLALFLNKNLIPAKSADLIMVLALTFRTSPLLNLNATIHLPSCLFRALLPIKELWNMLMRLEN